MSELPLLLGIDLGGTKSAVVLGQRDGAVHRRVEFPTRGPGDTLRRVLHEAAAFGGGWAAAGVACGGPLDARRGRLLAPPNLQGWENAELVATLAPALDCPVTLLNDVNAGALAEWAWGAGRGRSDVVFLTCGTGLGAGIVSGGRLVEGAGGNAGEIGHVRLSDDGPPGHGKRGSVEGWASGGGIGRAAEERGWPAGTSARSVVAAADRGDAESRAILGQAGSMLGRAVAVLVDLLNPEVVALGSLYVRARRHLEKPMRETLEAEALASSLASCEVVPAQLGERIGDLQALAAALQAEEQGR